MARRTTILAMELAYKCLTSFTIQSTHPDAARVRDICYTLLGVKHHRAEPNESGEWMRPLSALATAPPEQAASMGYPRLCGLCPGQIESEADLDWHGIGNCVPICNHCGGSGREPTRFGALLAYKCPNCDCMLYCAPDPPQAVSAGALDSISKTELFHLLFPEGTNAKFDTNDVPGMLDVYTHEVEQYTERRLAAHDQSGDLPHELDPRKRHEYEVVNDKEEFTRGRQWEISEFQRCLRDHRPSIGGLCSWCKAMDEREASHDQKVRAEVRDATLREVKKIYDDGAVSATVYNWLRSQLGLSVGASGAMGKK